MQWTVRPYTPADEAEWDRFVMHESGNGTFLQTRNFLNYHPAAGLRMPRSWSITSTAASAQCARGTAAGRCNENFPLPPGQHVWRAGAAQHLQLCG